VRTATQLLIFSGYAGGGDAGDAGTDNLVYVQAFDPTTANSLGPAQPLFAAPAGAGFVLESASIAPTGEIALAFNYGGSADWASASASQTSLYGAFLGASADAGPAGVALQRAPVEIESAQIEGQPHVIWSTATGAFVFSWVYVSSGWYVGTKSFLPNGQAAGGIDPVPSNQGNAQVGFGSASDQGSAAVGPDLMAQLRCGFPAPRPGTDTLRPMIVLPLAWTMSVCQDQSSYICSKKSNARDTGHKERGRVRTDVP